MDFSNYWWQSQDAPDPIDYSLRFKGAQFLNRTAVAPTEGRIWTLSFWIKPAKFETSQSVLSGNNTTTSYSHLLFHSSDKFMLSYDVGIAERQKIARGLRRDPSAWYHVHCTCDTTGNNSNNMVFFTINGVRNTPDDGVSNMQQNEVMNWQVAGTAVHIGNHLFNPAGGSFLEGYLAEYHFIDGQVVPATDFAEFDGNGVWIPSNVDIDDYGANGYYLDFKDPANIGADRSGNGNNFTPNGFELGDNTSVNWDQMIDHPTTNIATFNPLSTKSMPSYMDARPAYSRANQQATFDGKTSRQIGVTGSSSVLTGHWMYEVVVEDVGNNNRTQIGWTSAGDQPGYSTAQVSTQEVWYRNDATFRMGVGGAQAYGASWTTGDVIGCRLDLTGNGEVEFFINGVSQGIAENNLLAVQNWEGFTPFCGTGNQDNPGASNAVLDFNMGQRPFRFADSYPEDANPWAASYQTDAPIPKGSDHFRVITDTGANILTAAQTAFPSGLWIVKDRINAGDFQIANSVVGTGSVNTCPTVGAGAYTPPTGNSVAWGWNYNNADPTINGFDIVTYTGNGVGDTPVAHRLGKKPSFWLIFNYSAGNTLGQVHHQSFPDAGGFLYLNTNGAYATTGTLTKYPDASNIYITSGTATNRAGDQYVAYIWSAIPGFSSFGKYQGNSGTDGPFIECGFRPAFVLIRAMSGGMWLTLDSTRYPANTGDVPYVMFNSTYQEQVSPAANGYPDFLANGFKPRGISGAVNGVTEYVYAAFAENPFGGNNVSPANAR